MRFNFYTRIQIEIMARNENDISAIFFDNAPEHIETMNTLSHVTCIPIPQTPVAKDIPLPLNTNHFKGIHPYVIHAVTNGKNMDSYDELSGLRQIDYDKLKSWIQMTPSTQRYAIFDWDRTITKMEGMIIDFPTKDGRKDGTLADYIEYITEYYKPFDASFKFTTEMYMQYLCGADRMELLRSIFKECLENHLRIVILTNNSGCKTTGKPFDELMKTVGVEIKDFDIVCSVLYDGNKRVAYKMYLYQKTHPNATEEELSKKMLEEKKAYNNALRTDGGRRRKRRTQRKRHTRKRYTRRGLTRRT